MGYSTRQRRNWVSKSSRKSGLDIWLCSFWRSVFTKQIFTCFLWKVLFTLAMIESRSFYIREGNWSLRELESWIWIWFIHLALFFVLYLSGSCNGVMVIKILCENGNENLIFPIFLFLFLYKVLCKYPTRW